MKDAAKETQSDFINNCRNKIKDILEKCFKGQSGLYELHKINYQDNPSAIQEVLKLFNIHHHVQHKARCPLAKYKRTTWSLEHIHAQNSKDLSNEDRVEMFKAELNLIEKIPEINVELADHFSLGKEKFDALDNNKKIETMDSFYENIRQNGSGKLKETLGMVDDMHLLINMALLCRNKNSSLGNKIFINKRNEIINTAVCCGGKNCVIPVTTKLLFAKNYSEDVDNFYIWSKQDKDGYAKKLKECFEFYGLEKSNWEDKNELAK